MNNQYPFVVFSFCLFLGCAGSSMQNGNDLNIPARIIYTSTVMHDDGGRPIVDSSKYPVAPFDSLPVVIKTVTPIYPPIALRAGVEGEISYAVLVDTDGKPNKIRILIADAEMFMQPTAEAIQGWLFRPAIKDKQPVVCWAILKFRFVNSKVLCPK